MESEIVSRGSRLASGSWKTICRSLRSRFSAAHEARVRELAAPAIDAYFRDEIDEQELKARKKAAEASARAEDVAQPQLDKLNAVVEEHLTAQRAEQAAVQATQGAKARVEALLRAFEQEAAAGGAGSSSTDVAR